MTWEPVGVVVTADSPATSEVQITPEPVAREYESLQPEAWLHSFINYAAGTIWVAASSRSDQLAKEDLIASAEHALASVEAEHGVAMAAARETFEFVLQGLVEPGGPTPQPNVGEDGDIEVRWLVGGDLVSAMIYEDGGYRLRGLTREGRVLFAKRIRKGLLPDAETLRAATTQLAAMGKRVRFPALPRG